MKTNYQKMKKLSKKGILLGILLLLLAILSTFLVFGVRASKNKLNALQQSTNEASNVLD
ncbi:MAG: hypothetical protein VYE55_02110 [Verrucomicrobiota bacterium]|nr:hypothetical protein [Verrucomicrobiota bacterium]